MSGMYSEEELLKQATEYERGRYEEAKKREAIARELSEQWNAWKAAVEKNFNVERSKKADRHLRAITNRVRPHQVLARIKHRILNDEKQKEIKMQELESKRQALLYDEKVGRAIQFLIERGKVINSDFIPSTAIEAATNIAYAEEITRLEAEMGDGYIAFNGDDNCEDCRGWDGKDRRCECGNRRVSWSMGYESDFENMYVYAEAW